jgi:hypothetical protein
MNSHKRITSIAALEKLSQNKTIECFIALSGGMVRSSKEVLYDTNLKKFYITNEIDGSTDILTREELDTESNIATAIKNKCFYQYC